jgi:hypothetical protein
MARSGERGNRQLQEIGAATVAAWFKVLPDTNTNDDVSLILPMNEDELRVVFSEILDVPFELRIDPPLSDAMRKINIVIAQPPVYSRKDLVKYLNDYHKFSQGDHYHESLGRAMLFGCGR